MEAQIDDSDLVPVAAVCRPNRARIVREDELRRPGHCQDNLQCFARKSAPNVVSLFLPGMFHIAHEDCATIHAQIIPPQSADFAQTTRRIDCKDRQDVGGDLLPRIFRDSSQDFV